MKAIVYTKYGSPDVLQLQEVEKPVPGDDQIRVRVYAASVNALDWHFLRGTPLLLRFQFGLLKPKNKILGYDIAGRVDAVGKNVTRFQPGDEIFGGMGFGLGSFAEYACIDENAFVTLKPGNISFEEAAAVPAAAVTSLMGLNDRGNIQSGQKVLINGAAGGVGTFSVQIAKSNGAIVTGVCSTQNLDIVRSLGADNVIDYTCEDFTENEQEYDLVIDNVGNRTVSDLLRVLHSGGTCVIVGFTSMGRMLQHTLMGPLLARARNIKWVPSDSDEPVKEHIERLKKLIEDGKIVPFIDRQYPLNELANAIGYVETGHARGKVVITVNNNGHT